MYLLGAVVFPVSEARRHRAVDLVPALDENHVHDGGPQARGDVAAIVPIGIKRLVIVAKRTIFRRRAGKGEERGSSH